MMFNFFAYLEQPKITLCVSGTLYMMYRLKIFIIYLTNHVDYDILETVKEVIA
jgi:hypothetical protein